MTVPGTAFGEATDVAPTGAAPTALVGAGDGAAFAGGTPGSPAAPNLSDARASASGAEMVGALLTGGAATGADATGTESGTAEPTGAWFPGAVTPDVAAAPA